MLQHIASLYNLELRTVEGKVTVINKSTKSNIAQQQVCATIKKQYLVLVLEESIGTDSSSGMI